jgi:transposase
MDTMSLRSVIEKLEQEIGVLKAQNNLLHSRIEELIAKNGSLVTENAFLKQKIIKLEDKLNINSTNSGLPTSKDIYRIEKHTRAKSDRKAGAQLGHQINSYEMQAPDVIVEVMPEEDICKCGSTLTLEESFTAHQKIEIPVIKPVVTEYRLQQKVCVKCKRKYKGKLDNYRLLEKNAGSIITSLTGFFNNSKRDVQAILSNIFNLDLSLGLISNTEGRISETIEGKYKELVDQAEESSYLHLDETSHNNKGKRGWAWVAASQDVTVFKLANSRGKKALENFLPEYIGNVVSDRYAVYNIYDSEKRQICLAHLARDFKRFAHSKDIELAKVGNELHYIIGMVFKFYKLYKAGQMDRQRYLYVMQKIKDRMLYYLKSVSDIERWEQAQRVANNILKSFDMMWLFTRDDEIEPTNNFAERQIKHHVKYRKNSFFTWSERGDRFLERIKSLYATAKLQKLNPLQELREQLN